MRLAAGGRSRQKSAEAVSSGGGLTASACGAAIGGRRRRISKVQRLYVQLHNTCHNNRVREGVPDARAAADNSYTHAAVCVNVAYPLPRCVGSTCFVFLGPGQEWGDIDAARRG
jgi:hypothetical protein